MFVSYKELKDIFVQILLSRNLSVETANACATIFADTTAAGIFSHGVNRFPTFIRQIDNGDVIPENEAELILSLGAIERWDGHQAIGNITAQKMMQRATDIADQFGLGLVAIRNTNHWMRGGHYAWQAAKRGYIGICFTNSISAMPPWGGKESRIGTNPISIAIPGSPPTLIDMSMSMFSYGALEKYRLNHQNTPVDAGFDDEGKPTKNPEIIEKNRRALPMGYWKGSGLSIVIDQLATLLSSGLSVANITQQGSEYKLSQVFIAIALDKLMTIEERDKKLKEITDFTLSAAPDESGKSIRLPGHNQEQIIAKHMSDGIVIDDSIWEVLKTL